MSKEKPNKFINQETMNSIADDLIKLFSINKYFLTKNECKKQDDNHISYDIVKPGSVFMYCMIREPVKYITVASLTCGLTICALWILHR